MTREVAIDLGVNLKGLMSRMTDDQVEAATKHMLPVNPDAAKKAIERYAAAAPDFVLADFIKCLPALHSEEVAGPVEQTRDYLNRHRAIEKQIETEREELDRVILTLSEEELRFHRAAVLDGLDEFEPDQAALLARLDPRKSVTLKRLIAKRVLQRSPLEPSEKI